MIQHTIAWVLIAGMLGPAAALAQSPRIQQVSSYEHQHEKGTLLAHAYYIQNFDQLREPWPELESWIRSKQQDLDGLELFLLYKNRMATPDLQYLLSDLPMRGSPAKHALRKLAEQLTQDCVLLYWHAGGRGAFLKHPQQHRERFEQMIEQL
jgi:hypothetical protein